MVFLILILKGVKIQLILLIHIYNAVLYYMEFGLRFKFYFSVIGKYLQGLTVPNPKMNFETHLLFRIEKFFHVICAINVI